MRKSKTLEEMRVLKRRNVFLALAACALAGALAAAILMLVGRQLMRPTMRDAVFVRKIEKLMRKDEACEAETDARAARI